METEGAQRVLIDTNVLIFSFKSPSDKGDTEKARHDEAQRRNTMRLLEDCRRQGREVVVASVSVSEALERMPLKGGTGNADIQVQVRTAPRRDRRSVLDIHA